jgi:hypothetical protein
LEGVGDGVTGIEGVGVSRGGDVSKTSVGTGGGVEGGAKVRVSVPLNVVGQIIIFIIGSRKPDFWSGVVNLNIVVKITVVESGSIRSIINIFFCTYLCSGGRFVTLNKNGFHIMSQI